MNTPPFFAVQKQQQNGIATLLAVEYTLDQNDLDPTMHNAFFVDTLTIPAQTFTLKGKNLSIFARKVVIADGAVFDTTGASQSTFVPPYNPPKASNGSGPGQGGSPGKDGGITPETTAQDGQAAGTITIKAGTITGKFTTKAIGGKGQQGQNGQDSGDGIDGSTGADAIINRVDHDWQHPDGWDITPATPGDNGGSAGAGGNAGKSGNGGAGGAITLSVLNALAGDQVSHQNNGGDPGAAATPGKAGQIGHGGQGGRIAVETTDHTHFHNVNWYLSDDRQDGSQDGSSASDGHPAATAATKGADGAYTATTLADATKLLDVNTQVLCLLQLTMRYAEIAYLENNREQAGDYYIWIAGITAAVTGTTGLEGELANINKQCRALLHQLNQGLDFYANPINYVPIVTLDYYQQSLDTMLATGNAMESVYNDYTAYLANQQHDFTGMNNMIDQAQKVIANYQSIQSNLGTQVLALSPIIDQLTSALAAQYTVVTNADASFRKAVEARQGCSLASLLGLLKTIMTVGVDAYTAFTTPTPKSVSSMIGDFIDIGIKIDNGKLIEDPNAIQGDPNSIAKAWQGINPSGDGQVNDSKKLVILQDDFDKAIKPYMDLPEAQNYLKQVHDYIGIAEARNAKMLEYTNDIIQYLALNGQIAQKQLEVDRIKAQIAQENVPGLITYRNFIFNLYQDFKSFVLKYLYQENRAYIYWSQTDSPFNIADNSFVGLSQFHSTLTGNIINRINTYSNPDQPLTDIRIMLTPEGREQQFADFRTNRTLTFEISSSDPAFLGWANVLLTNFRVYINGAVIGDGASLYAQLIHQGRVVMIDPSDGVHHYTHNQVLSVYQYRMTNGQPVTAAGGSMGGDGTGGNKKRIALSPFATFTINVPEKYNPGVALDKTDSIEIHFSGYAVPPLKTSRRAQLLDHANSL